jgi:flagellar operon protein
MAVDPIHSNPAIAPPGVASPAAAPARVAPAGPARTGAASFDQVLRRQLDQGREVRFSGHALARLERRGVDVDPATMARLREGVDKAAAKGSRDALVLIDQTAFVVSVRNRTVITAVPSQNMRDRVFTNIDSAVIN